MNPTTPSSAGSSLPLDSVPFLLVLFDETGRVRQWNGAAREALSLGEGASAEAAAAAVGPAVCEAVGTCVAAGRPARVEQVGLRIGAAERLFGFTAFPLRAGDRVEGALVTGQDITDRVRLRDELQGIEQSAQVERVSRLFSGALRDLLNTIRGNAQYLSMGRVDAGSLGESAAAIVQAADRMDRLLQDIEELGGAGDLRLQLVDPEPCLREAVRLVLPLFRERAASLSVRLHSPLGSLMHDPDRLQRVLVSLLTNAAEATGFGGWAELRAGALPGGGLWAEVCDDGPGIDPLVRASLFDLFVSTKDTPAAGLGLAIAQEIVHHHGGRIKVASEPGKGCTFRVEIPGP